MASDCVIHRDLTDKASRSIDGLWGCVPAIRPLPSFPPASFQERLYPHPVCDLTKEA